jgi:hypothetical protein
VFSATPIIVILIIIVIGIAGTTIYYTSSQPPPMHDWITNGVKAGCTATPNSVYGIPTSLICPSGVIRNLTIAGDQS